ANCRKRDYLALTADFRQADLPTIFRRTVGRRMSPLTVSLVVEPPPSELVAVQGSSRQMLAVDVFAEALGHALAAPVKVVEGPWVAAPREGLLLLYPTGSVPEQLAAAPDRKEAAERIFLMDVSRQQLPLVLEDNGLAGAVEAYRSPERPGEVSRRILERH